MYRMQLKNKPESRVSVALKPGFRVWFGKMAGFPHGPGFSKPGFQSLLRTIWVITVYSMCSWLQEAYQAKITAVLFWNSFLLWHDCCRISLNTMTLQIQSDHVYTQLGVAISVTGIAQVCVCYSSCISLHCISLLLRPRERFRSTVMSMFVCPSVGLSVCLSVCLSICGSVCLSARISLEPHARSLPTFLCMLPKKCVAQSSWHIDNRPHRLLPDRGFLPHWKCIISWERGMAVHSADKLCYLWLPCFYFTMQYASNS